MVSEILGSFILVVVYLTQTENHYKLSTDAAITLMIISGAYCVAMVLASTYAWSTSPLNPAIALAEISYATFNGDIDLLSWSWIYLTFSWLGSILAVLMFECGFKRASDIIERKEDEDEIAAEVNAETAQPLLEE